MPEGLRPRTRAEFDRWIGTTGRSVDREMTAREINRIFTATETGAEPASRPGKSERPAAAQAAAVPTGFCPDPIVAAAEMGLELPRFCSRHIDGGTEWEIHRVARVGERLRMTAGIASITERQTADGRPMVFTVIEVSATGADGRLVGVARGTVIDHEARS